MPYINQTCSHASYLCSCSFTESLIQEITNSPSKTNKNYCLAALNLLTSVPLTLHSLSAMPQSSVTHEIDKKIWDDISCQLQSMHDQARLKSLRLPKSGAWLNAFPSKNLGLHLKSREFRVALQYRLGIPVFQKDGICPACGAASDREGDHAIACG